MPAGSDDVTEVEVRVDGGAWQTGEFTRQGIKPVTTPAQDMMDDFVPPGFTVDPQGVDDEYPNEYISVREGITENWMPFSLPARAFGEGREGQGGAGYEEAFAATRPGDEPTDPLDVWGYKEPVAPWHTLIGDTDLSLTFTILWAVQRPTVGAPATGDYIPGLWEAKYKKNATADAEVITLNTPPNLSVAPGDGYAVITFDRNSGGALASDLYIRGSRIRYREDGQDDDDWIEIEDGDGGAYTPYYLFGLTNGTTYNIEVSLVYRAPPTFCATIR